MEIVKLLEDFICLDMIFSELGGYSNPKTLRNALKNKGIEIIKFGKKQYINNDDLKSIFSKSTTRQNENQIVKSLNTTKEAKKVNEIGSGFKKITPNQNDKIEKIKNRKNKNECELRKI